MLAAASSQWTNEQHSKNKTSHFHTASMVVFQYYRCVSYTSKSLNWAIVHSNSLPAILSKLSKFEFNFLHIEDLQFTPLCFLKSDWFNNQSQRNSKYNLVQPWNEQRLHNLSSEDLEPEPIDQRNSPSSHWSEPWVKKKFITVAAAVVLCVTRLTWTPHA